MLATFLLLFELFLLSGVLVVRTLSNILDLVNVGLYFLGQRWAFSRRNTTNNRSLEEVNSTPDDRKVMGGEDGENQILRRIAAETYDYENDSRWADYWSNLLIPPHMASLDSVVDHFKRKFYQRYIVRLFR